ncbi:hypothetical protein RFF05_13315 [Bengtsoniella intestinalis]|uniref:transmembrane-type terpene cyclase n=1 Tax=Bengtsoniella intestinalis TaxID=3073143 RepID=UPI00391FB348
MTTFLTLLSGIAWTIVYIEAIRKGFKDKSYAMPLFALGLNIAWEAIYTINGLAAPTIQTPINFIWCALDAVIVVTYFKYGKKYVPDAAKKYFVPFSVLAFATTFAIQMAFYLHFISSEAASYSAFLQNAAMSILFLTMLFHRQSKEGQSVLLAVAKWIGTLAPTISFALIQDFNIFILITGIICSVFDILYIIALVKWDDIKPAIKTA